MLDYVLNVYDIVYPLVLTIGSAILFSNWCCSKALIPFFDRLISAKHVGHVEIIFKAFLYSSNVAMSELSLVVSVALARCIKNFDLL